jgi:hypothetical protein
MSVRDGCPVRHLARAQSAAQIANDIVLGASHCDSIAKDLPDKLEQTAGGFQLSSLLNGLYHGKNIPWLHLGDMHGSKRREEIGFHPEQDGSPVLGREIRCLACMPFQGDIFEGIAFSGKFCLA